LASRWREIVTNADLLSELAPETEERMLCGLADTVVRYGLETPATFFLETMKPLAVYTSAFTLTIGAPVLELFGVDGYKYASLFQKRDSVEKLMKRIEDRAKQGKAVS
jgi:hypothetical protein